MTGKDSICQNLKSMKSKDIIPNDEILRYYFYFIQERMNIFWRKCNGESCLTKDSILQRYKFTNVYRACDRVSQYLISEVIYKDIEKYTPEDMLLRIIVFKIFNRIETWKYIQETYGDITIQHFDVPELTLVLSKRQKECPIFSNAYMMTGSHHRYASCHTKHEKWLTMVKDEFLGEDVIGQILKAKSLQEVYELLRQCSFLGDFIAYQYAIDFNYSPYINFDENSFVKAGIGAIRGIKKCFVSYGNKYEDAIEYVHHHFYELQQKYGYDDFRSLPGHTPTLLDLQNCFCETDKYLREKKPALQIGNKRIKQKYVPTYSKIDFMFPPKWGVKANLKQRSNSLLFDSTI